MSACTGRKQTPHSRSWLKIGRWQNEFTPPPLSVYTRQYPQGPRTRQKVTDSGHSFTVYAGSSVYVAGVPEIMLQYRVSQQEAMLGLSLYVFSCKSLHAHSDTEVISYIQMASVHFCGLL